MNKKIQSIGVPPQLAAKLAALRRGEILPLGAFRLVGLVKGCRVALVGPGGDLVGVWERGA